MSNVHSQTSEGKHSGQYTSSDALAAALYYYDHDCCVVPCCTMTPTGTCMFPHTHTTEKSIGKVPLLGHGWQHARLTHEEILHVWTKYPAANVGVLLEPSDLLVIDLDSDDATEEASRNGLPPGPQVRAGRGVHHYFRNPKHIIGLTIKQGDSRAIDVLSKGIVVGFGSIHRSGKRYELLTSWEEWPLEDPPLWAEHLLLDSLKNHGAAADVSDDLPPVDLDSLRLPRWLSSLIREGHTIHPEKYPSRSEAVWAVVTSLVEAGHETDTIASILLDPRYTISAKPREQGARWLAGEIGRARAKTQAKSGNGKDPGNRKADPEEETAPASAEEAARELPEISITTDLTGMVDAAEHALMNLPGPVLYQRAKMICRIAPAGESPKWLQRPPDTPIVTRADTVSLREYSGQSAQWVKYDKRAKAWSPVLPPSVIFETLAARVTWKFPYLEGIICAPTLRPDGVLVSAPGYDKETGLYLDLNGVAFPAMPNVPTLDDAKAALDILSAPFADFPFKDEFHRSAALAAVLTLVGRFAIPGNVPAFPVRAHAKGSGKGLLVNVIATIGTGRTAPTWTQTRDDAEEAKRLLSIALAGDACMHIDNVTKPFGSDKLDSAITSPTVKDRLLGVNASQEAPWLTVIFASGNNMTFVGDMVRRVVPIDLDPKIEHPEERGGFRHTPLLEWVNAERPRLVVAALTILKAFFHAGCPKQPDIPEFGSFERWADLIRHGLIWAGFSDPCAGRKNLEEESDTSYEALAALLQCWADCYPDTQARTLKVITQDIERRQTPEPSALTPANEWNALHDALSTYDGKYDGKRLDTKRIGNAMRSIEGRVLDNQRLIRTGEYRKVALWKREVLK
jgi:hypothetical protein